jgi:SAM-dependent methyltransferase
MLRRVASRVSMRSRRRKLDLLLELLQPGPETTVVDLGVTDAPFGNGSTDNFFEALYPWPERITGVGHTELDRFAAAFPQVRAVRADGRALPFADGAFDLGFSNAVVEHIAGGREGQRRFVHELCRVAGSVFVTTPNRWFPLEVHTLLPLVHWLPAGARERLIPFDDVLEPLGPKQFASLFPYSVRVINTGMTLIAVGPVSRHDTGNAGTLAPLSPPSSLRR